MTPTNSSQAMDRLIQLMACLRDPEHGCAWDRKQTLHSLTHHTLEEVYEVIDAIDEGNPQKICDELGDLLFQVVFYARIAEEERLFDLTDIARAITDKLLRRHPHIFPDGTLQSFGQPSALTAEQVEKNWETIKNAERDAAAASGRSSVMDDVARAMPALDRAGKLQKRAASLNFDWHNIDEVFECVREELDELHVAMAQGDTAAMQHELGDVLFSCVNLARHLKQSPEQALSEANKRFETRFRSMEQQARNMSVSMADQPADTLETWWQRAKQENQ